MLKAHGYATGQFGKNHLGDRDEHLPTMHGFDEFFGNLYHLNAEEEPENPDYPKDPKFREEVRAARRAEVQGDDGHAQGAAATIENTGPLEHEAHGDDRRGVPRRGARISSSAAHGRQPWFCYFNSTRMHVFTHLKKESQGKTGLGLYPDGMVEHDGHVGQLLALLDELGVADNTIVVYTTDNGAEVFTWPDGGTTPFRGEKATNWEGGFRVPCVIRWPGVIKPGTVVNDLCAHEDFIPTFAAAAGDAGPRRQGEEGRQDRRQDLQGAPRRPQPDAVLQGRGEEIAARGLHLLERRRRPDGDARAPLEGRLHGAEHRGDPRHRSGFGRASSRSCARPCCYNLRADPFERGDGEHLLRRLVRRTGCSCSCRRRRSSARWLESFKEFPPRAKAASFTVSDAMEKITTASAHQN